MPKINYLATLSIFIGIILLAVSAMASPPDAEKLIFDDKNNYPGPDEFIPVDKTPEMIYEAVPEYPRLARQAGMEAIVWIKSLVNRKGNVVKAIIFKSSGSKAGFDKAALKAAYKNQFTPAIKDGKPVAIWVTYSVEFSLGKEKTKGKSND